MRKNLFKRPAWSSTEPISAKTENDEDLFRHSQETFAGILAERERRKQVKEERERYEREIEDTAKVKRRKISEDDSPKDERRGNSDQLLRSSTEERSDGGLSLNELNTTEHTPQQTIRPSDEDSPIRRRSRTTLDKDDPKLSVLVAEEDSDIEVVADGHPQTPEDPESSDSDDDEQFRELKRRARETARLRKLGQNKVETSTINYSRLSPRTAESTSQRVDSPRGPVCEPAVQIIISSRIPESTPLIALCKLSSKLGTARLAFFRNFEDSVETQKLIDTTFLIWKGNRLFDVTSLKSLGIQVDEDGGIFEQGGSRRLSTMYQRIHLELVTPEIYEDYKQLRARQHTLDLDNDDEDEDDDLVQAQEPESGFVVILKNKGLDEVSIRITPATTITTMIDEFRRTRSIGTDEQISLYFDGDCLRAEMTAEECDLGDMDKIDVHIK